MGINVSVQKIIKITLAPVRLLFGLGRANWPCLHHKNKRGNPGHNLNATDSISRSSDKGNKNKSLRPPPRDILKTHEIISVKALNHVGGKQVFI